MPVKLLKALFVILTTVLMFAILSGTATARGADEQTWPLYVNVEQDGKLITGLNASNFRVFLDGRAQQFEIAAPETPTSIVLLVEYSQLSGSFLDDMANGIRGFIDHAPEENWYGLMTFARTSEIITDFTKNKYAIASSFASLPPPGWSEIDSYDAILNVIDRTARLPGRRVIVFIGSGFNTFSTVSFDDVQKRLESSDVSIYCLGLGSALRTSSSFDSASEMELLVARSFLNMLAKKSGGEAWFPNFGKGFDDAMEGVMQDLTTQYKLVVNGAIPDDDRFHKIKVEAFTVTNDKRQNFTARVREGFRRP